MAKIANVALTNTFNTWRINSNIGFDRLSQFAVKNSALYANTITANVSFTSTGLATLSGRATVGTNLTVSGNTTLGAAGKTITTTGVAAHTGRTTISTNLTVSGNTALAALSATTGTFSGDATVGNATTANHSLNINAQATTGQGNLVWQENGTPKWTAYYLASDAKWHLYSSAASSDILAASTTGLSLTGTATVSSLTASKPVFTDASKVLVSTGTLAYDQGGTGQTSYAAGDIVYASGINTLAKLAIGSAGQRLVVAAGLPSWATDTTTGTVTSVAAITLGTTGTDLSSTVANGTTTPVITLQVPTASAANRGALSAADWTTFNNKQASGSYITSGGALGTPSSGTLTNCTFPTLNQNTSGTSSNITAYTINQSVGSGNSPTFAGLTINGAITASGDITAFYSDRRLKTNVVAIPNALTKVMSLNGILYTPNKLAESFGFKAGENIVGLFADELEAILPEAVKPAPFDTDENGNSKSGENYKTIQYEKVVPLLIEAIKDLNRKIDQLQNRQHSQ